MKVLKDDLVVISLKVFPSMISTNLFSSHTCLVTPKKWIFVFFNSNNPIGLQMANF